MDSTLSILVERLEDPAMERTNVIRWGCPVPSFGDLCSSRIATLGLNPSNREFVDIYGNELEGDSRRFHTLKSLGLTKWSNARERHLCQIAESCRTYFSRNPYDTWFKKLDYLISGTGASYYSTSLTGCHLDLIPYATACKWTDLTRKQRMSLLTLAGDTLGLLLLRSPVRVIILNGNAVVHQFQEIAEMQVEKQAMLDWSLPRSSGADVTGFAYRGSVRYLAGVRLQREILVLGYNHNIQSSYGVTTQVTTAIRRWIADTAKRVIS